MRFSLSRSLLPVTQQVIYLCSGSSRVIGAAAILMLLLFVAAGLTAYFLGKNVGLFQGKTKPENEKPASEYASQYF